MIGENGTLLEEKVDRETLDLKGKWLIHLKI